MAKVYCGECGAFVAEVNLEKGYVVGATCADCIKRAALHNQLA